MTDRYEVRVLTGKDPIKVSVPGSKSITNRALLLAALSKGTVKLHGVLFSDDSRVLMSALSGLGFPLTIREEEREVVVTGCGGDLPQKEGEVYVGSAGTAARFLTVMLAVCGGRFHMTSSPQMEKRPMEPLLSALKELGVSFSFEKEEGHFPFVMNSSGIKKAELSIDTTISSQFASALLLSGAAMKEGLTLHLTGDRIEGSYIGITLGMMEQFSLQYEKKEETITVPGQTFSKDQYFVEPDASAAGYFWAIGALTNRPVTVKGIHGDSLQGDIKVAGVFRRMGCLVEDTLEGLLVCGPESLPFPGKLRGLTVNMKDYSDQTMTVCAVAPFCDSPVTITGISHIRHQESDRMAGIVAELSRMGIVCTMGEDGDSLTVMPGTIKPCEVETYEDHRMAMAFAVCGTVVPGIVIKNPDCCRKTFEQYFEVLSGLR